MTRHRHPVNGDRTGGRDPNRARDADRRATEAELLQERSSRSHGQASSRPLLRRRSEESADGLRAHYDAEPARLGLATEHLDRGLWRRTEDFEPDQRD